MSSPVVLCSSARLVCFSSERLRWPQEAFQKTPLVNSETTCSHKGAHITERVAKLTECSMTRKNAECRGLTGST